MNNENFYKRIIIGISILVPLLVSILLFMPTKISFYGINPKILPHVNAIINSLTAILLFISFIMIKLRNIRLHKILMMTSFILGSIFLLSYIIYHSSVESTSYLGEKRILYYFFLISHVLLSIIVVPFVLFAFYFSLSNQIPKHKKIVKYTFPIWLYVSISGVIVYLMISPYY